jgi:Asp-tRNA(Asn)/Glu-tRNA(Gln) amidotransferase C subunit
MGKRLGLALPVLSQMLPKTRLNNRYCKMAVGGLRGGRYYAVNLEAFRKYETVEVRCHSSTTDYRKIMNWVEIVRAIAYSDIKKQVRTVNDLTDVVRIREDVVEYMTQRIEHFNPQPKSLSDLISEVKVDQAHAYADSDDITDLETREAIGF